MNCSLALCETLIMRVQVSMNSVERLIEYAAFEPEAAPVIPGRRPPAGWPQEGAIQVSNLVLRYSPTSDPVLRGLTFSVGARQKACPICMEQHYTR